MGGYYNSIGSHTHRAYNTSADPLLPAKNYKEKTRKKHKKAKLAHRTVDSVPTEKQLPAAEKPANFLTKTLKERSVSVIHALKKLKNYAIRIFVTIRPVISDTTAGLGISIVASSVARFVIASAPRFIAVALAAPALVAIAPLAITAIHVTGGICGFITGVDTAINKWNERVKKEKDERDKTEETKNTLNEEELKEKRRKLVRLIKKIKPIAVARVPNEQAHICFVDRERFLKST